MGRCRGHVMPPPPSWTIITTNSEVYSNFFWSSIHAKKLSIIIFADFFPPFRFKFWIPLNKAKHPCSNSITKYKYIPLPEWVKGERRGGRAGDAPRPCGRLCPGWPTSCQMPFTGPNRNLLADILLVYQKRSCKMPVFPTQIRILGLHRLFWYPASGIFNFSL